MKVLVVDDDPAKYSAIESVISQSLPGETPHDITHARSLANAIRILSEISFDLVVLDLMLPYLADGPTDSRAGLELLRQLRTEGTKNRTTSVITLSSYPDEVAAFRDKFDE